MTQTYMALHEQASFMQSGMNLIMLEKYIML